MRWEKRKKKENKKKHAAASPIQIFSYSHCFRRRLPRHQPHAPPILGTWKATMNPPAAGHCITQGTKEEVHFDSRKFPSKSVFTNGANVNYESRQDLGLLELSVILAVLRGTVHVWEGKWLVNDAGGNRGERVGQPWTSGTLFLLGRHS